MGKNLLIAGGGHAHMVTLANLNAFVENGHNVTVIGPSEYHYYSGMGPGMLGKTYGPEDIRFATKHLVEKKGGTFVLGKVLKIDPRSQVVYLESGESVPYDVLSCNLGSQVQQDIIRDDLEDIFLVKPIERLLVAQKRIMSLGSRKNLVIGVIGGGPSAVEIAGNIWKLAQDSDLKSAHIKLLAGSKIMPHHPDALRVKIRASLTKRGIEILENCRVNEIRTGHVTVPSGKDHELDIIFVAIGVMPNPVFKNSGILIGPDGGLRVNPYLQSTEYENIFGGGDCIYFEEAPLNKVGVYAVRQNPILYHNLMATLEGKDLQRFDPGGDYLLIFNLGDGTGILHKWGIQFGGRLAFIIKDFIDRKFMQKFQSLE